LLTKTRRLRRKQYSLLQAHHLFTIYCYYKYAKCSPVALSLTVRWWRHCWLPSINCRECCALLYQQCQFEKTRQNDNLFQINNCFSLKPWVIFCWQFCDITVIVTILSLVTIQGSVCTQTRWGGQFSTHCLALIYLPNLIEICGQFKVIAKIFGLLFVDTVYNIESTDPRIMFD